MLFFLVVRIHVCLLNSQKTRQPDWTYRSAGAVALTRAIEVFFNESFSPQVLSFYLRAFRDQLSQRFFEGIEFAVALFSSREMTSYETGGILLDGTCPPVCDRVSSPTFLPSLIPLYLYISKSLAK